MRQHYAPERKKERKETETETERHIARKEKSSLQMMIAECGCVAFKSVDIERPVNL